MVLAACLTLNPRIFMKCMHWACFLILHSFSFSFVICTAFLVPICHTDSQLKYMKTFIVWIKLQLWYILILRILHIRPVLQVSFFNVPFNNTVDYVPVKGLGAGGFIRFRYAFSDDINNLRLLKTNTVWGNRLRFLLDFSGFSCHSFNIATFW